MKKICIIPARMGSSRYPGKPLEKAIGIPLIVHVAKRCSLLRSLDYIAVATCDLEIAEVCQNNGISFIMTSDLHERCTDRVSEAVGKLNFEVKEDDLVIMVQGDEILITPNMINSVINDYIEHKAPATNLLSRIYNNDDYQDPNVVKVVSSFKQQALYLSRAPIPSNYRDKSTPIYQQTGVIAFKRQFLDNFSNLPQTPLEKIESIDMLRILEHELTLRVVYTENETIAVDIPSDLIRAEEILKKDHLLKQYA